MALPPEVETALVARGHRWSRVRPLAGDVSRRRYLRLLDLRLLDGARRSAVVAVYPRDLRDACRRFRLTTELLGGVGVRVPEILDFDCEGTAVGEAGGSGSGWMLVEDLGTETLYERFRCDRDSWPGLRSWYLEAVSILRRIAEIPLERVAALNPPLDRALLLRELDMTWEAFFEPRGLTRERGTGRRLDELLGSLCRAIGSGDADGETLLEIPKQTPVKALVPCHRDFMVRNLVPLDPPSTTPGQVGEDEAGEGGEARSLGVLDHQDLRPGPRFYDLASLLNDSLFPPPELEEELLAALAVSGEDVSRYRQAAVQRTLKAVGTYARHRRHEELIRPTFERALDHLEKLPGNADLARQLRAAVIW
jgi:aminoglycoside/choline kinase family phosphotransferase